MLNYLKITGHKVGLIINFKQAKVRMGTHRFITPVHYLYSC